jgi:hypothetical protein
MGQAASQRRILVVEDDPFICMSAVTALNAKDSAGALMPACHGEICVPITDLQVSRPQQPCGVRYE